MTKTTEAVNLSIEELDAIDLDQLDKESADALHPDDLMYLLKRKLDEVPASKSLQLLGAMMNFSAEKLDTLATILQLGEIIHIDLTSEPAATVIKGTVETLEETIGLIQVVIDRFGVKE